MSLSPKNILFYLFLLGVVTWACVNPIKDFVQIDATSFTTIEADISDDPELSKVRLTSSSNRLTSQLAYPISKAVVTVTDQSGTKTSFTEGIPVGTYYPPKGFVGKVGSTYTLNVKMLTGQTYESTAETMKAVPEIENAITRFETFEQYDKVDVRRAGFTVYLDFKDMPSEGDFYLWNWKHYEKIGFCATCTDGGKYDFKKLDCVQPKFPTDAILNYMCDGNCWDITTNNDLNVFSDVLTNGQRVVGRQVARIPFDNWTPYYFRLEQRSITKNAFAFYQSLISQVQSSGSLFDVPAETRFSLNIKSVTKPTERVLGIFNVFSVRKKIFIIDRRKDIPVGELPIISIIPGDTYACPPGSVGCQDKAPCIESTTRTKITPEGWVF
ncbi:DUF4249 domain-containing protein [Aquirufa lenticrescens]|uniref:DUF4249 domain-containing protein n=1 Tax=Aquirufa lenticrescens TaxID=2696560 RepID=UPI001CAA7E34|nr:DUF4249 domain-containing protein [Aquirufa lenticrescens]UAJ14696.1 DUF4249 domain-containing protein [Aquirufa lenticrescens]